MNKLELNEYNLQMTLLGGQAFNFDLEEGTFYGFTQDKVIQLKIPVGAYCNMPLQWQTYPKKDDFNFLKKYLRLNVNYPKILKTIQKDKFIKRAVKKYPDLRLMKQDFEQTLLSFLISPNNNIKSIRKIIREMNKRFSKKVTVNSKTIYLFPETEVIANAKLEDLLECKLGFRAKYLKGAAKYLLKSNLSSKIENLSEADARNELKMIPGIGDKIADCILVFSLSHDDITPLDVWGKRIFVNYYKLNPKTKYEDMRDWASKYFNGYAAWAGQFLYEYIRHNDL